MPEELVTAVRVPPIDPEETAMVTVTLASGWLLMLVASTSTGLRVVPAVVLLGWVTYASAATGGVTS